jgi:hypothetical protein
MEKKFKFFDKCQEIEQKLVGNVIWRMFLFFFILEEHGVYKWELSMKEGKPMMQEGKKTQVSIVFRKTLGITPREEQEGTRFGKRINSPAFYYKEKIHARLGTVRFGGENVRDWDSDSSYFATRGVVKAFQCGRSRKQTRRERML